MALHRRCVLDADDSNAVMADEFRRFLRLGDSRLLKKERKALFGGQGGGGDKPQGFSFTTSEAIMSMPTKDMRTELEAANEPLPSEAHLKQIAQLFIQRLAALRIKQCQDHDLP